MFKTGGQSVFDGTTGRTEHGGRRTHIIQLLRDTKVPLSVTDVAERVGIHVNTARFHLESLVDAGLAERTQQARTTPGRPKVLYVGTLPNQTHERAQGYRLLAETLASAVGQHMPEPEAVMYEVGRVWGRYLTDSPAPFERLTEEDVSERLVAKMDALWFAPMIATEPNRASPATPPADIVVMQNCPFLETARRNPEVVCTLHAGLTNGALSELGSSRRAVELIPLVSDHHCVARLAITDLSAYDENDPVPLDLSWFHAGAS